MALLLLLNWRWKFVNGEVTDDVTVEVFFGLIGTGRREAGRLPTPPVVDEGGLFFLGRPTFLEEKLVILENRSYRFSFKME